MKISSILNNKYMILVYIIIISSIINLLVSYIYYHYTSFNLAIIGSLILIIIKYLYARWLHFNIKSAIVIVCLGILSYIMYFIVEVIPYNGSYIYEEVGAPQYFITIYDKLNNLPQAEIIQMIVAYITFILLIWKFGWFSIIVYWLYMSLIPEPMDIIRDKIFGFYDETRWIKSALDYMPWKFSLEIAILLIIGILIPIIKRLYKRIIERKRKNNTTNAI